MKRYIASALVLSLFSLVALPGCEDKAVDKKVETTTTPGGGTTKTTDEHKVESTGGDKAPANSSGETAKTAEPPK